MRTITLRSPTPFAATTKLSRLSCGAIEVGTRCVEAYAKCERQCPQPIVDTLSRDLAAVGWLERLGENDHDDGDHEERDTKTVLPSKKGVFWLLSSGCFCQVQATMSTLVLFVVDHTNVRAKSRDEKHHQTRTNTNIQKPFYFSCWDIYSQKNHPQSIVKLFFSQPKTLHSITDRYQ